ncbi:MAG: hypothetical protein KJP20_01535 [Bacteroidia bacterium]|nr:hypothetical protein [Bacteroidia bacterium]NNL33542.1 hypothetical protein [Flavobacteriaceae bacterium]
MKTIITFLLLVLITVPSKAQVTEFQIETKSVEINDLISFVVETFEAEDIDAKSITFLIQANSDELDGESLVMLKQGFKLISERLSEDSHVSLVTYGTFNGVALPKTNAKELKLILHTLTDLKGSIVQFYKDGISLAYEQAQENYDESAANLVVMIRINKKAENTVVDIEKEEAKAKKNKKKGALLVSALALLPEIINLIKD